MNERISKIIEYYKLTPSEFADEIEVSRSSISQITTGRNKPSLDFVAKIKDKFPNLSWDWLIYGQGEMHNKPEVKKLNPSDLFSIIESENFGKESSTPLSHYPTEEIAQESLIPNQDEQKEILNDSQPLEKNNLSTKTQIMDNQKDKIKKIILLYENGKFESFEP